jgi:cysteine desulfurase
VQSQSPFEAFFPDFNFLRSEGVYADFASSTPVDSRVLERILPFFTSNFANPANRLHSFGSKAEFSLTECRELIGNLFNLNSQGVVFTSSATESINLFIRGVVETERQKWLAPGIAQRNLLAYGATEHSAVKETIFDICKLYPEFRSVELPVLPDGQLNIAQANKLLSSQTLVACVQDINNETGIFQSNLPSLFELCNHLGIILFTDASQGFPRSLNFVSQTVQNCHAFCINSSKVYGPKGASALCIKEKKPKVKLHAQITGGGQEFGIRSSTQNLPAIVGMAYAAKLQIESQTERHTHLNALLQAFLSELSNHSHAKILAASNGIASVAFENCNGMKLIEECENICVSVGSACRTMQATASAVLLAQGFDTATALAAIRVSFGLPNSIQDAVLCAQTLALKAKLLAM